jgi:hypothetical protein
MKKTYSMYAIGFGLVLASAVLITFPPTALAATCETTCSNGEVIRVSGESCACNANGCTYTDSNGVRKTKLCSIGNDDLPEAEEGPMN